MSILEKVKLFCIENYNNGYDEFVECYEDIELEEYIIHWEIKSIKDFIEVSRARREYREEIQNTAF